MFVSLFRARCLCCVLLALLFSSHLSAEQNPPCVQVESPCEAQEQPLIIPNMQGDMVIDGVIDEQAWEQAHEIDLIYVTRPFENTTPPVKTRVRIIENGDTLFVAFDAQDPDPEAIGAFYRDRDMVSTDDLVGVKLDTFNDRRLAYQFFVNPFGIQVDSIENEMTGQESASWNAIWESKGRITENGFQVELAIPLRIMNFPEGQEHKVWGAEFVRFYPREDRLRISNIPIDRNNSCTLCQLGEISGFDRAMQSENLAIIPTIVLGRGRSRDPSTTQDWDYFTVDEPGLDVQWGITPEISLQATLNPDFSQVESDVAQLAINNTFALFFPERRPFFLENADYFSSNYNLVFTRNVGAPDFGGKVTGRIDNHTLGVFVANDANTNFLVPGNSGSTIATVEEKTTNVALRYRYDVSNDLSFGVVNTLRTAGDYHNYVFGLDTKYQVTPQDILRVEVVRTETQYPTDLFREFCDDDACADDSQFTEAALRLRKDDAFSGLGYRINYRHEERDWFFRADRFANGADFRADLGFVSRVDRNSNVIGGGYVWWNEESWWNRIQLSGDWDIHHTDDGELLERESQIELGVNARLQSYFEVGFTTRERVGLREDNSTLRIDDNTTMFAEDVYHAYFEFQPTNNLYYETFVRHGDQIDFDNNRLGKSLLIEPRLEWSIGRHLQLNLRHTYQDLRVNDSKLFIANLSDARITYQFDQEQFLRLIVIYSDIDRNPANYTFDVDSVSRDIGMQLLYSYTVNPLTRFFVGYSSAGFRDDVVTSMIHIVMQGAGNLLDFVVHGVLPVSKVNNTCPCFPLSLFDKADLQFPVGAVQRFRLHTLKITPKGVGGAFDCNGISRCQWLHASPVYSVLLSCERFLLRHVDVFVSGAYST